MQANTDTTQPPRLSLCALMVAAATAAALAFGAAFHHAPPRSASHDHTGHGHHGTDPKPNGGPHEHHAEAPAVGSTFYAGGLWSNDLQLSQLGALAAELAAPGKPMVSYSLRWHDGKLVVIDTTPPAAGAREGKPVVFLSIDIKDKAPDEFPLAIEAFVETLADAPRIIAIPPIPGDKAWPDEVSPNDWTFLWLGEEEDYADWESLKPKKDLPGVTRSGYLLSWLELAAPDYAASSGTKTPELIKALERNADAKARAQALWALGMRDPYKVVPAVDAWLAAATKENRTHRLHTALTLRRAMGVHADAMIAEAAASEDPSLRRHAARAIGDLADQTRNALGRLTKLAEDREMTVRQAALLACRQIPGRRAAGVAQLVETYEMDAAMRSAYIETMAQLAAYGEPIEADSRLNIARRMSFDELMAQERDALVSRVLLERTELPDDMIPALIATIAEEQKSKPLPAYIDLLSTMSPATLARRTPLLKALAGWDTNELKQNAPALVKPIQAGVPQRLQAALAGALIQSSDSSAVEERLGRSPLVFQGLAWVTDTEKLTEWSGTVLSTALGEGDVEPTLQAAALDAIKLLPGDSVGPESIESLLSIARTAKVIDLRFAGIRAINSLPDDQKPDDIDDLELATLSLRAAEGGVMKYDTEKLTVTAGQPVELTLINPDTMEHNLLITKPGKRVEVGIAAAGLTADVNYIPDSSDVLHAIPIVRPGKANTIRFFAPTAPGNYDYVCTIPGHYATMYGTLEVRSR